MRRSLLIPAPGVRIGFRHIRQPPNPEIRVSDSSDFAPSRETEAPARPGGSMTGIIADRDRDHGDRQREQDDSDCDRPDFPLGRVRLHRLLRLHRHGIAPDARRARRGCRTANGTLDRNHGQNSMRGALPIGYPEAHGHAGACRALEATLTVIASVARQSRSTSRHELSRYSQQPFRSSLVMLRTSVWQTPARGGDGCLAQ